MTTDQDGQKPRAPLARRPVEESLGDALIRSIDAFVFRDIEDEESSIAVFDFVDDSDARHVLGRALMGARWMQKAGLALARDREHPAHAVLVRSQLIEYGAIVELVLREAVRQERPTGIPATMQGLIDRATDAGLLSAKAVNAATRRRLARNQVHLAVEPDAATGSETAKALKDTTLIINELRARAGLDPWLPKRATRQGG